MAPTIPKIQHKGIYISTVDSTRETDTFGKMGNMLSTKDSVTYYRYLRFYPDGSVISLKTFTDPETMVPHFTKNNVSIALAPKGINQALFHDPSASVAPGAVMKTLAYAYLGHWALAPPVDTDQESILSNERDIIIKTDGIPDSEYVQTMRLSLRYSKPPKADQVEPASPIETTLIWKEFRDYRRKNGEEYEFDLLDKKPYVFQRVRG